MTRTLLFTTLCLLLCMVCGHLEAEATPNPSSQKMVSCPQCHGDFTSLLGNKHPKAKGKTISACLGCHKPADKGSATSNTLFSKLHKPHLTGSSKVECTGCHTWTPGKIFGLPGTARSFGAPTRDQLALLKRIFMTWAGSPYLDGLHGKGSVSCSGCHGSALPEKGDTVDNERCLACHGPIERIVAITTPKDFADRNPHKSHLGEIACTVCHKAHEPSVVYCLGVTGFSR
jgi:hypothetical protein